jgi:hypothetical protein
VRLSSSSDQQRDDKMDEAHADSLLALLTQLYRKVEQISSMCGGSGKSLNPGGEYLFVVMG